MVDILYSVIDLVCVIILAVLGFQNENNIIIGQKQRQFKILTLFSILYCLQDAIWGAVASHHFLNYSYLGLFTYISYISSGWMALCCSKFLLSFSGLAKKIKKLTLISIIQIVPFVIYVAILVFNYFNNFLFTIDNDTYFRGDKTLSVGLFFSIHWIYYLTSFVVAVITLLKKEGDVRLRKSIVAFAALPIITGSLQLFYPSYPYYAIGFMFSCFVVFIFDVIADREVASGQAQEAKQKLVFDQCNEVLSSGNDVDRNIPILLSLITKYYDADRVTLCEYRDENNALIDCKYEHTRKGAAKRIHTLQGLDVTESNKWMGQLAMDNNYYCPNLYDIIDGKGELAKELKKYNIISAIFSSYRIGGKDFGYMIVDNPRTMTNDFSVIRTVSIFINSEIVRGKLYEQQQKKSSAVLEALAAEYTSVYYISFETGILEPYRSDIQLNNKVGSFFIDKINYEKALEIFIDKIVCDEFKSEIAKVSSIEYLKKKLKNKNNFRKQFKAVINDKEEYFQAKFVKVESKKGYPVAVVMGLANIDESVRDHELIIEQRKQLENVQNRLNSAIERAETATKNSQIDRLTGLYNKVSGQLLTEDYLKNKHASEKYAIIFIDIDKFKVFNDDYGHLTGDEILKTVGQIIKTKCRQNDIPIRFGGDEFIIVLKNVVDEKPALEKAKQIQKELAEISKDKEYNLTCSIGIYITTTPDFDDAIENADNALYDVKESGRNDIKIL